MELTKNQERIFLDRYAFKEEATPEEMWFRVADAVATNKYEEGIFYELLKDFAYVPGGRILSAMGTETSLTAMNCYVLPSPEDSRQGIMKSLSDWVEIQSKGGGVGINMSSLRPRGAAVKGVNGTSSGPVVWAQMFAYASKEVIQQGGSRRGAAMIMLDVDHPDIMEFIHAKETPGVLEGANISVCISNEFMEAVAGDFAWATKWNGVGSYDYPVYNAREIWDAICEAAWKSAEPGIYFMERANDMANSWYFEEFNATNPCAEQPLGPYGACLLGSINLASDRFWYRDMFSTAELERVVKDAVRFNDNIIDSSSYPLDECRESQQNIRRMGIGVVGFADYLLKKKIRYGSQFSVNEAERLMKVIRDTAYRTSKELAQEKGAFPLFDNEQYLLGSFIDSLPRELKSDIFDYGIRNCYLLSQAPTGTISILAGVNSGIEPYFDFDYLRKDRTGEAVYRSEWADLYYSDNRPDWLVTAHDVTPEEHIAVQAAFQKYIDSAISKTVNAPEAQTVDDVRRLYQLAYDSGLKSISYYRDNSRNEQVLYKNPAVPSDTSTEVVQVENRPRRRKLPDERNSVTHRFSVGGQNGYITVGLFEDGQPGEIFINFSKVGSMVRSLLDQLATQVSINLQHGVSLQTVVDHFNGTQFEPYGFTTNPEIQNVTSILDYIGRWLTKRFIHEDVDLGQGDRQQQYISSGNGCPECGGILQYSEGCNSCVKCGFSKC